MRKPGLPGACWPTPLQEDLLRVVVAPEDEALVAWSRLRPRLVLDELWDPEVQRLLPKVYVRLLDAGIADPDLPRMKGLYRRTWYLNQRRIHATLPWVGRLVAEGFDVVALKGVVLALDREADLGRRPMQDVDVLLPAYQVPAALDLLEADGFADVGGTSRPTLFRLHHGAGLARPDGVELDVHWNLGAPFLLPGDGRPRHGGAVPPGGASMADLIDAAVPFEAAGVSLRALCPADLLLHVVVHGVWAGSGSTVRWLTDLATLLADPRDDPRHAIDWGRLVAQARARHLTVAVGSALWYASRTFGLPVPEAVVDELAPWRAGAAERRRFERMALDLDAGDERLRGFRHLRAYWAYASAALDPVTRARTLPHFLAELWDEPSPATVPAAFLRRVRRRSGEPVRAAGPGSPNPASPPPTLTVSVVVPTLRRPDHLARCLHALAAQRVPADEVVVVHRDDDHASVAALAPWVGATVGSSPLRTVRVAEPGLVRALHAGAAAASGTVVAFTDDDARPRADWVEGIRHHLGNERVGAVGGRDVTEQDGDPVHHPRGRVGLVTWYGGFVGDHALGTGGPRPVQHLKGVSMAYRADLLRFPAGLRGDGAEVYNELALGLNVAAAGATIVYDPELLVDHDHGPRFDADDRQGASAGARANAVYNQSFILFSVLPRWRRAARLAYVVGWGDRGVGGVVCCAGLRVRRDPDLRGLWARYLRANLDAWRDARRSPMLLVAAGQPFPARSAGGPP